MILKHHSPLHVVVPAAAVAFLGLDGAWGQISCPVPATPTGLFDAPVPPELMTTVAAELPESSNVNSAFLNPAYDPNLVISATAAITVTFLAEGAGFKNTLGYFTYNDQTFASLTHGDVNLDGIRGVSLDELAAVPGVQLGMIFGNASGAGSGGTLNAGDAIELGAGTLFPPGTRVGFFLVQNGWTGSGVRGLCGDETSELVMYTLDMLNPECDASATIETDSSANSSRHVAMLFADLNAESILMGIEDLHRTDPSENDFGIPSDEDFNDAVFRVTSTPSEAISQTDIPDAVPVFPQVPPEMFTLPDCCSIDTSSVIATYLPEQTNVDAEYLNPAYDPNLIVAVDTTLVVSFVDEGASYPNTLGMYVYDDGTFDGLTKADVDANGDGVVIIDEVLLVDGVSVGVVFQNSGELGEGGPLTPLDSVLVGDGQVVPSGSRVAFFLIQDGWVGDGYIRSLGGHPEQRLVFHTIDFLNPEAEPTATLATDSSTNSSRHVAMLFSDDEYNSILIGFEDLHRLDPLQNVYGFPSDEDFNDSIFCLTPVEYAALSGTNIFVPGLCPADLDGNGTVAFPDLLQVIVNWGTCLDCEADLDGNGAVDMVDLLAVLLSFGECT
ncbi:MAG: DUF4114 domain-containing protein [Planctomycetota bacterium]|jgi:hypothetical protein